MPTEGSGKKRVLLLVDENMWPILSKVLEGYRSIRVVELDEEEVPLPPGKRLVSEEGWDVLKRGARLGTDELRASLATMGTTSLAREHWTPSEHWMVAELRRRERNEENFDDE